MVIRHSQTRNRWEALTEYRESDLRDQLKQLRWRWDPDMKCWWTNDVTAVFPLEQFVHQQHRPQLEHARATMQMSTAVTTTTDIDVPAPDGKKYLPYQKVGIQFASQRRYTLLADEMGLGKTIQAIGLVNLIRPNRVMVICPAIMKLRWQHELNEWLVDQYQIVVLNSKPVLNHGKAIHIVNYDILGKHSFGEYDIVIVDEAHYIRNPQAQRTKLTQQIIHSSRAKHVLFLTGTPVLNKPIDLFPILKIAGLEDNLYRYAFKYRMAISEKIGKKEVIRFVPPPRQYAEKLQTMLRSTIMIRRQKADVLSELPPKVRLVIPVDLVEGKAEEDWIAEVKHKIQEVKGDYKQKIEQLRDLKRMGMATLAKLRHATALAKVPYVVQYVREMMEQEHKVVVFAHHLDVLHALHQGLSEYNPVLITGETPQNERQTYIDRFMSSDCRVFIGSITACGQGITLTQASHVVFAELDWSAEIIRQAEDRIHRIGQKDTVFVHYIVADRSVDARIAQRMVQKEETNRFVLDPFGEDASISIEEFKQEVSL